MESLVPMPVVVALSDSVLGSNFKACVSLVGLYGLGMGTTRNAGSEQQNLKLFLTGRFGKVFLEC